MLELKNLSKTYRTGDKALSERDADRAERPGHGADRAVRRRQVNADPLHQPAGGADIGQVSCWAPTSPLRAPGALRKMRRKMGMIFQEYALVERLTVMENVLSGRLGYVGFWRSYFLRKYPQV
jgi:phosphonate transport system ATP-binding protein